MNKTTTRSAGYWRYAILLAAVALCVAYFASLQAAYADGASDQANEHVASTLPALPSTKASGVTTDAAQAQDAVTASGVVSKRIVKDGIYEIRFTADKSFALGLADSAYANGVNVQLAKCDKSLGQRWAISWEKDGYYSVKSVASTKPIEAEGGKTALRTNVQTGANSGADEQRWAIVKSANLRVRLRRTEPT